MVRFLHHLYTLTLHGLPASGDCVVGYTVRVPFSVTFVSRSANSVSLENKFYQQLLSTSLRVFHGYNNVETYPVPLIGDVEFLLTRPLRDVTATFCIYVTEHFHILGRTYFC